MTISVNQHLGYHTEDGPIRPSQGIYEISSTAKAPLGTRVRVGDRVFHYAYAGGVNLAAGVVLQPATAAVAEEGVSPSAAVTINSTEFTLVTAAAQDNSEEGYIFIHEAAGAGYSYRIKKATANTTLSTSTDLVLYDPLHVALTGSSELAIMNNMYYDLDIHTTTEEKYSVGVAPTAVTLNNYFWCQTWGPAAVLMSGTEDAAGGLMTASGTAGAITVQVGFTYNIIGVQLYKGTDEEFQPVYLQITP